jgi:hypothetical protein
MTSTTAGDQILIQDSKGRVRTPRWRQEALLEEYEKSGMSGAAFAEHLGIKYQTFATWTQKKRKRAQSEQKAPGENHPVQWVEAVVPADPRVSENGMALIVQLGGGARMEIADRNGAILAAEILRHLGETR